MIRPLTTTLTRTTTTLLFRNPTTLRSTYTFSTSTLRHKDQSSSIIPPSVKQTAKAIDQAAAAAALKGIEVGERVADATRNVVGSTTASARRQTEEISGVDMYGERESSNAVGANAKTAANEARGSVNEIVGDAMGKVKEAKEEAKGQASKFAGQASGKASEVAGEARGKKEELKGRVKGSVAEERGNLGV